MTRLRTAQLSFGCSLEEDPVHFLWGMVSLEEMKLRTVSLEVNTPVVIESPMMDSSLLEMVSSEVMEVRLDLFHMFPESSFYTFPCHLNLNLGFLTVIVALGMVSVGIMLEEESFCLAKVAGVQE